MATKFEYYSADDDSQGGFYGVYWHAQTFTTTDSFTITSVKLLVARVGASGTLTISIREVDGDGKPKVTDLCSKSIDSTDLTTNPDVGEWYEFTFVSSYLLSASTMYAIVVRCTGTDNDNRCYWRFDGSSPTYTGGQDLYSSDSGSNWTAFASVDRMFETWGDPILPGAPTNPSPGHTNTEVDFSGLVLDWDAGDDTDTFDVYIGPLGSLVQVAFAIEPSTYTVDISDVPTGQVIYWRVDATNVYDTTIGDIWNFDARPGQVSTFTPLNEATGLTLSEVRSTWESPSDNTDSYNIYFGIESGDLFLVDNTVDLLLDLVEVFPTYNYTYYWRIDAVNDFGITLGDEVYFTTDPFYPPLPTGITLDGDGNPTGTPTGENNIMAVRRLIAAADNKIWIEDI